MAPLADAVPSLELPDGHMRQRPYDEVVLDAARRYRQHDVVAITNAAFGPHNGHVGVVGEITGTFRPLPVEVPGVGVIYCAENEVQLVTARSDEADTLIMDALLDDDVVLMGGAR